VSRLVLLYFGVLLLPGFVVIRYAIYKIVVARRRSGDLTRIVILGCDKVAAEMAAKIEAHPEMGWEVVGFVYLQDHTAPDLMRTSGQSTTVRTLEVIDLLAHNKVDQLILVDPQPAQREVLNLVAHCRSVGIQVSVVPHLYELYLSRPTIVDLEGLPVLCFEEPGAPWPALAAKRLIDLVLGAILLILASPLIAGSAILLFYTKGKAFRRELRCGQYGKRFWMYRMNVDRLFKGASRVERFLDAVSIAELPNLLNVLLGDMSLVGPRPESFDRTRRYSDWTRQRLNVKPGITGLAQVHGLRDQHSSEEKAYFDLQYCLKSSLFADFTLIVQTIWTLLARLIRPFPVGQAAAAGLNNAVTEVLASAHSSQPSAD